MKIEIPEIAEGFAISIGWGKPVLNGRVMTKEEYVIDKYLSPFFNDMKNYLSTEVRKQVEAQAKEQIQQAEDQAMEAAQRLVVITKDETTSN
jgi:hypothetical protein